MDPGAMLGYWLSAVTGRERAASQSAIQYVCLEEEYYA
jgi:hypothetical protein